jgi:hypothetical protein
MRKEEAKDLRAIFLSKDKHAAQEELHRLVTKYWTKAPSCAGGPEKNVPEVWRSSNSRPSIAAPSDPSRPARIRKRMGDRKESHVHPLVKPTRIQQKQDAVPKGRNGKRTWTRTGFAPSRLRVSYRILGQVRHQRDSRSRYREWRLGENQRSDWMKQKKPPWRAMGAI